MVGELTAVVRAVAEAAGKPVPAGLRAVTVTDAHRAIAAALHSGGRRAVILGSLAQRHPAYSELKALAAAAAALAGASVGVITEGANAAGAYLAGAVPHRDAGGRPVAPGLSARAMLEAGLKAYVLFGGIDPANDLAAGPAGLASAELVVAATTHLSPALAAVAHVVLPIGSFAESAGTYVNAEGRWQSWAGAAKLVGESRPGWKVLRVLANLLGLPGNEYVSSDEVRDELKRACGDLVAWPPASVAATAPIAARAFAPVADAEWVDIPPYQGDVLVRGSEALAKTKDGHVSRTVI
jgi:NADH-quinone oxidoreductase subunit G